MAPSPPSSDIAPKSEAEVPESTEVAPNIPETGLEDGQAQGLTWQRGWRWLRGGFWTGLGYMLSPLSWWNDVFFNLPIAYAFGYLVSWLNGDWFLPGTVAGYWLSNVIGIVMMQVGITDVVQGDRQRNLKRDVIWGVVGSTVYSVVIVLLARWNILPLPDLSFNLS